MGRQVLICYLCLLALAKTSAKSVNTAGLTDSVSSESVPRLYGDRSLGVYASATPYAAYSFHVPTFVVPKNNVIPVKEESVVVQNVNGYLKDSYGQRFVQAPQTLAYKSTIPQQFVQLQNLPAHLSQPLVTAAPTVHYATPQFFGQRLTNFQTFSPIPINNIASPQHLIYTNNVQNVSPSSATNAQYQGFPTSQHQSPINNVYTKVQSDPQLQEEPKVSATNDRKNQQQQQQQQHQQQQHQNNLQLVQAPKQHVYTSINNGQKTVYTINSKPSVPLLDLTLLEPLKFANPIIPQVQHYLPRINNVKYQKLPEVEMVKKHQMEFIVQNTKSYDSESSKPKAKKESTKKKQKKQNPQNAAKNEEEFHETPTDTNHDTPQGNPELTYEINSPNYKETYTEKKISYNKQTQSEPVHTSYDEQSQGKPKHYSYEKRNELKPINYNHVYSSKRPGQGNQEHYNTHKETPKQHVQNNEEKINDPQNTPQIASADSGQSSGDDNKERNRAHEENESHKSHDESEGSRKSYERPQHEQVYYNHESDDVPPAFNTKLQKPHKGYTRNEQHHYQPITPEYEEDIKLLPTHQPHPQRHYNDNSDRYPTSQSNNEQPHNDHKPYYFSAPIVVDTSKRGNDNEESPEANAELMDKMVKKLRENEEDFEKAYKDAAYGFPAFDTPSFDAEKNIYNPESYGALNYYKDYDIRKSPLIQYEADGDDFPKFTRSHYKDIRDKTNDDYFDHYVASKPESIAERNKKKEEYYQTYINQQPEYYLPNENNDKNQKAKYTSYNFNVKPQTPQTHSKIHAAPNYEGYDYPQQASRDNAPHATQNFQRYKSRTQFVEPQYQYGFEPVSIPELLDSEMAVMATVLSHKKDKSGIRKKDSIDNNSWLVKKQNTKSKVAS